MSVYTVVNRAELEGFLTHYPLGGLLDFEGIRAGIENTNYFVTTSSGEYVLTLFEQLSAAELDYFLDLMAFLAEHGVPTAHPVADEQGRYLRTLKGKPAALVQRLPGKSVARPGVNHCATLGRELGRIHSVGRGFPLRRRNSRGPGWWSQTARRLLPLLPQEDRRLLEDELAFQKNYHFEELPRSVIHADLFRDNALFVGERLTGIIDLYYACDGLMLYDLAITANDWAVTGAGSLDEPRLRALLGGYREQRPFLPCEALAWPVILRAAALRFWLSRLNDLHFPREGEITHSKDPDTFKRILVSHRENQRQLRRFWERFSP